MDQVERDPLIIIPVSALQHYVFCPTQCALIHIDLVWEENEDTTKGKILHQNVDKYGVTKRKEHVETQGETIYNLQLGISAKPDKIIWEHDMPVPYEMKKGKSKATVADTVQLCAGGLCLESQTNRTVEHGILYYWEEKKSHKIEFTPQLREITLRVISETRKLLESGKIPLGKSHKGCSRCSLKLTCMPV